MDFSFFKNLFSNPPKAGEEKVKEKPEQEKTPAQELVDEQSEGIQDEVQVKPARQSRRASQKGGKRKERESRSKEQAEPQPEEVERLMAKLEEFVLFTAKSLVDSPEEVATQIVHRDNGSAIIISCAKKDTGKIIGKSGKIIAAIRILVSGAASKIGLKATADIDE